MINRFSYDDGAPIVLCDTYHGLLSKGLTPINCIRTVMCLLTSVEKKYLYAISPQKFVFLHGHRTSDSI